MSSMLRSGNPALKKETGKLMPIARNGVFVFPVYSKNSIIKSFDLSVNISSKTSHTLL